MSCPQPPIAIQDPVIIKAEPDWGVPRKPAPRPRFTVGDFKFNNRFSSRTAFHPYVKQPRWTPAYARMPVARRVCQMPPLEREPLMQGVEIEFFPPFALENRAPFNPRL